MVDAGAVEKWLKSHPKRAFHEQLFGSEAPEVVSSFIGDAVAAIEGTPPLAIFQYQVGLVASAGVELADGRRVFAKIYPDSFERWEVLRAARAVQAQLCDLGLPVPRPRDIRRISSNFVAVDEYLPGRIRECRDGPMRCEMAARLAELIGAAPPPSAFPELSASRLHLYPWVAAHQDDPEDFAGALDYYRRVLDSRRLDMVVAHLDWRVQNVAWTGGAIAAIYDWDSVAITSEAGAVGAAAGMYSYDFRDSVPHVPTPIEVKEFIDEYGTRRPVDYTAACAAAGLKMVGYAAWEHRLDRSGARLGARSYRSALRNHWAAYRSVFAGHTNDGLRRFAKG